MASSECGGGALKPKQALMVAAPVIAVVAILVLLPTLLPTQETETPTGPYTIIRPPSDVTCMVPWDNTLWVGGKLGVVGIDIDMRETRDLTLDIKLSYVRHMILDGDSLFIGHDNGLTIWDGSTSTTYTSKDGLVDGRVSYILRRGDGVLWVGTTQGAYYQSGGSWGRVTTSDGLLSDQVNVMLDDGDGGLWFGSDVAPLGGITLLKDGVYTHFSTENGLPHNDINSFYLDADGSVWAATGLLDVGGAVHFVKSGGEWKISEVLTKADGLPEGKVRAVYRDPSGVLWISTENEGVARIDGAKVNILTEETGLSHSEVKVFWTDSGGNLWMGTRNGVTILTAEDQKNLSFM
jgi:ligand-binding sensor domain-containing protein